jgi:type II restriction enzyme
MPTLTIADLVNEIGRLDKRRQYPYVSGRGAVQIIEINPEGPITCQRWSNLADPPSLANITTGQLATLAAACSENPNYPIHIDRLLGAGGNTRTLLETLLVHTPHFFICYPKRIDYYTGEILTNQKHIMWCPDEAHELGTITEKPYEDLVAKVEFDVSFGQIDINQQDLEEEFDSIEAKRLHTQIQIALAEIGRALAFRTWLATNDRHIPVGNTTLGQLPGVIPALDEIGILYTPRIRDAAAYVDCIWFKETEGTFNIPAVIEIEHSTGVQPGLTRMLRLQEAMGAVQTKYVIVAPDNLRSLVVDKANERIFRPLRAQYMPYSTVRVLYGLVKRFHLTDSVDHTFIEPFLVTIVQ